MTPQPTAEPVASTNQVHADAIIQLQGVTKRYDHVVALDNVDFHVGPGEVVGLLGDNGAGKSTLIKIMSGIVPATSGEILHKGQPVVLRSRKESYALGIETIYQDIALVDDMDIMRNIFLGREECGRFGFMKIRQMNDKAMKVLEHTVGISGITSPHQEVKGLSGGQKQAVALARAVHFRNRALLLDEPTSALSVRETEKTLEYIADLRNEGISCVLVTHNIYHGYQVADRFVVLSHGNVIRTCTRDETSIEELTEIIVKN